MKIEAAQRLSNRRGRGLRTRPIKAGRETGEGAGAIFYCLKTDRFLILLRSDQGDQGNTWCGLGGGRDNDEPLDETVRREAWEEAQFPQDAVCDLHYIDALEHPDGFTFHNYLALVPREFEPKLNEEHTDARWCKWSEFPENMHPEMMKVLTSKLGRMVLRKHCDVPF